MDTYTFAVPPFEFHIRVDESIPTDEVRCNRASAAKLFGASAIMNGEGRTFDVPAAAPEAPVPPPTLRRGRPSGRPNSPRKYFARLDSMGLKGYTIEQVQAAMAKDSKLLTPLQREVLEYGFGGRRARPVRMIKDKFGMTQYRAVKTRQAALVALGFPVVSTTWERDDHRSPRPTRTVKL